LKKRNISNILTRIHSTNNREFVTHQSTMKIAITTLFILILACTTNADGRKLKTGGRGGMTKKNDKKGMKGSSSSKKGGKKGVGMVLFSGSFADPNHPNCQRIISVDGPTLTVKGTDGNPGCPPDGSGEEFEVAGRVWSSGDNMMIIIDFTPKGGPPDIMAVWDSTLPAGILFADGNKWILI
jgi:hypothetical protein